MDVTLTENAAKQIKALCAKHQANMVRLSVDGGGCSGFQYHWAFAEDAAAGDQVFEKDGARLVIDDVSIPFVVGSSIDFVREMVGESFKVNNPNAESGCGCGASFSIK